MATGRLGAVAPSAATYTQLYKPGAGLTGVVSVSMANRSASAQAKIRVAITTASAPSAPANGEFVEYDTLLLPNESMQVTGLFVNDSTEISVYSDTANCSFVAWGVEE